MIVLDLACGDEKQLQFFYSRKNHYLIIHISISYISINTTTVPGLGTPYPGCVTTERVWTIRCGWLARQRAVLQRKAPALQ